MGRYKTWTLNWTIEWISYGLNFGLDFDSRMYKLTSCFTTFQALPLSTFLIASSLVPKLGIIQSSLSAQMLAFKS